MSKPENPVPGYKHLLIEPYTPTIGAVVHDFDLADIKDSDARAELRKALAEFQVLFFRKQKLSPAEQVAVARVFGDPDGPSRSPQGKSLINCNKSESRQNM